MNAAPAPCPSLSLPFKGDVYRHMAAAVHGLACASLATEEQRKQAKVVTLGLVYGMGREDMAQKLGIVPAAADRLRQRFLGCFPGVAAFMQRCKAQARELGYVRTLTGRLRLLPEMRAAGQSVRAYGERKSVNSAIQGTAADLMKAGMIACVACVLVPARLACLALHVARRPQRRCRAAAPRYGGAAASPGAPAPDPRRNPRGGSRTARGHCPVRPSLRSLRCTATGR